ncbi:MAG TPA: aminotransferase class I/II-fold pyridoxal phosphate-dependent enzyme, partial [Ramlibacter sp.]|nr:aminotransferase class I/II-fold pyridoxal phosphate-dependent enzyme [Ramlibacter sp.]
MTMLEHGGNLLRAAEEFGVPPERWLDLSTGISPFGYPVPPVPDWAWQCLPNCDDALRRAAADYYRTSGSLPVPGTQAAIQALPRLRPHSRVTLPILTYSEHGHAWRRYGHSVREMPAREFEKQLGQTDVLIVCNPNNPTGENTEPRQLLEWQARLAARGGWLVLDEAYIDATPEHS